MIVTNTLMLYPHHHYDAYNIYILITFNFLFSSQNNLGINDKKTDT